MNPKAKALHPITRKIYVKVLTSTDTTGYIEPKAVCWKDGRIFQIESVLDHQPANTVGKNFVGDCYTVLIHGQEKYLFHEWLHPQYHHTPVGRWFVETLENRSASGS